MQNFILSSQSSLEFLNTAIVGTGTQFTNKGGSATSSIGSNMRFRNSSSAGGGAFICEGSTVEQGFGGGISFLDNSTADHGTFITTSGTAFNAYGGSIGFSGTASAGDAMFNISGGAVWSISFYGSSTAGNATFINNGASDGNESGSIIFWDTSTAGNATITNDGSNSSFDGGLTAFGSSSTAGNASLIANERPGGTGGVITFSGNSTGGTSRVSVFGSGVFQNGRLEIGGHNGAGVTVGSIEGSGNVFLGSKKLTVGSNNASTIFSGVIWDGGISGGSGAVGGSLGKIGGGTLRLSGANTYTGGTIVNAGTLLANNSSGSAVGTGAVVVNAGGTFGGTGTISGPVTVNAGAVLLGGDPAAASGSLRVANNVTLNSGAIIQLVLGASGAHSTLTRTGGTWTFAPNQAFSFINLGAQPGVYDNVITDLADPGGTASWTITTPGFAGTFAYDGTGNIDLTITSAPPPPPTTLGNIATRLRVETGDNVLIGGFIVTGTQPKRVILRALGPSLPLAGTLVDPVLELRNSSGGLIMSNDNWRTGGQEAEIIATTIPPSNDLESAIVATLPANGSAYTAIVRGLNNGTGIGVVEAYDLDQTANSKLANISTRGFVQTGDDVLIGGLIVLGQNPLRVIVRAIGPSLPLSGALENPTLNLHDGNGTLLVSNDNWRDDPVQESEIIATGIPPSDDLESAIVRNLTPGSYTAIVRGVGNTTGIAVVEAYGLN